MKLNDLGITRLSPSSIDAWRSSPSLWCLRYLFGWKDMAGPAASRGTAVEGGLKTYLYDSTTDINQLYAQVERIYESNLVGEVGTLVDAERKLLRPMLDTAICAVRYREITSVVGSQLRVSAILPGLDIEVAGYMDFVVNDGEIIELKTTKRIPSTPRASHLAQGAFYRYARDLSPLSLLYVSDRRFVFHSISDYEVKREIARLQSDAQSLIKCVEAFDSPEEMLSALPASGKFDWSEDAFSFRRRVLEIL